MARTLSEMRGYSPSRRRTKAQDDLDERSRLSVVGLDSMFAEAVWSNVTCEAFCGACRAQARCPVVDLLMPAETLCGACGQRIDAEKE